MKIAKNLSEYLTDENTELPSSKAVDETIEELVELYQRSPGGFTYNPYFGDLAGQPFYVVSLWPELTGILDKESKLRAVLREFLEGKEELLRDPRNNVGGWYDVEEDSFYLDISAAFPDLHDAVQLGNSYNQQAAYALAGNVTIPLDGSGYELPGWPPKAERLPELKRGASID